MNCVSVLSAQLKNIELSCCPQHTTYIENGVPKSSVDWVDHECPSLVNVKEGGSVWPQVVVGVVLLLVAIASAVCIWGAVKRRWCRSVCKGPKRQTEDAAVQVDGDVPV